ALAVADVFVLATREDRHVRLTIEAAKRRIPVVRTDGVGQVLGDIEPVVDYLDGAALAEAVGELVADPDRRRSLGQAAEAAATAVHDTESGVPEVTAVLASVMR
ncbi:MAG: glycosyltransferase, partial [Actinomycetota bacterium]